MKTSELVKQYQDRARAEMEAGDNCTITRGLPTVEVLINEECYFFSGAEAQALIDEADAALNGLIDPEDYILASAQNW